MNLKKIRIFELSKNGDEKIKKIIVTTDERILDAEELAKNEVMRLNKLGGRHVFDLHEVEGYASFFREYTKNDLEVENKEHLSYIKELLRRDQRVQAIAATAKSTGCKLIQAQIFCDHLKIQMANEPLEKPEGL